jgi:ankyrin repeat protein
MCGAALAVPAVGRVSLHAAEAKLDARVADAAMREDSAAVSALLRERADVNGAQGDGMTALPLGGGAWRPRADGDVAQGRRQAVGADAHRTRTRRSTSPRRAAQPQVVQLLVDAGADVRALTTTGAAPLHFAAASAAPRR